MPRPAYTPPTCACRKLPHAPDCPVAPYFAQSERITLDSEQGDYHDDPPFILTCPKGCRFHQFEHAVGYDYTPISGSTESTEIPLVCPNCGRSDKQYLPAIVGHDPNEVSEEDDRFTITCPSTACQSEWGRDDGVLSVWLEQIVLKGVEEAIIRGVTFYKGQIVERYSELSIECLNCGHSAGETED